MENIGLSAHELLTTTRSVRKRLDLQRPVPRQAIVDALEIALQAPTGSNLQTWHWMIIEDAEKKQALADLYGQAADPYFEISEQLAEAETSTDERAQRAPAVISSARYLREHLHEVPAMVIPCMWGRTDGETVNAASFYGSILPAAWSFMMALRLQGIGSAWTTLHLAFEKDAAEILGIPFDKVTQCGLFPVAYTKGTDFKPAKRLPLEGILHIDTW